MQVNALKKSRCMQVNALVKRILSWISWGQDVEEKKMKGWPPPRCELSAKLESDDPTERVTSHGEGRNIALIDSSMMHLAIPSIESRGSSSGSVPGMRNP